MNVDATIRLIQLSLSPIALISGAGLLLLSITNRLGRTIDRSRSLLREHEHDEELKEQLRILLRRSRLLRNSAGFIGTSVFFSTMAVFSLLSQVVLEWPAETAVFLFLFASTAGLCGAMIAFLMDISLGLKALKVDIRRFTE